MIGTHLLFEAKRGTKPSCTAARPSTKIEVRGCGGLFVDMVYRRSPKMNNPRKEVDMGFTKRPFLEGTRMCLIYDNDEQRKMIIGQFLARGIALGEQVGHFADMSTPEEVETWLQKMGIDLPTRKRNGEFKVFKAAEDIYCPSGRFTPSEMLSTLGGCYDKAIQAGYQGARISGEMSWALRGIPGSERLLEYEALINTIIEAHPVTPICQYDARRFDGATLLNVLKVHPWMIVRGKIVQNPYFIAPQEFLKEFKPRQ